MQKGILISFSIISLLTSCANNQPQTQTTAQQAKVNNALSKKSTSAQQYAFANEPLAENVVYKTNSVKNKPVVESKKSLNPPVQVSLKDKYKNYFPVGTAVNVTDFSNPQTVNLITTQFASLSPKTALQPLRVHPKEDTYNWTEGDAVVDFAQKNNLLVRGHVLIYDKHMPKWFYQDGDKPASKDLVLQRIKAHIDAVVSRYKGKMYCWDVVNEAMRKDDKLYAICGEDYITKAFEYAHEADPSAVLFYNDGIYDAQNRDKFYKLIKKWKSQGVPISGVGIQYHLGIEGKSASDIQQDIDAFSSLGVQVQITELDISIYPRMSTPETVRNVSDSLTTSVEDQQANVYKTIFEVCKKNKGKVTGVTIWGIGDGDSFLVQKLNKRNYPYLFTNNLQPKKAFNEVINAQ